MSRTRRKRRDVEAYRRFDNEEEYDSHRQAWASGAVKPPRPKPPEEPIAHTEWMWSEVDPHGYARAVMAWNTYYKRVAAWHASPEYRAWDKRRAYQRNHMGKHAYKEYLCAHSAWMQSDSGYGPDRPSRDWINSYITKPMRRAHKRAIHKVYRSDVHDPPDVVLEERHIGWWWLYY